MLTADFTERLNVFAHKLQEMLAEHYDPPPKVQVSEHGRSKLRVYLDWGDPETEQVYCFISIDGTLVKASGWKTAKWAQPLASSIYDEDFGLSTCSDHGIDYPGLQSVRYSSANLRRG